MQLNDVLYYCIFVTVIYHYFISLLIIIIAITGYNVITTVITTINCVVLFSYIAVLRVHNAMCYLCYEILAHWSQKSILLTDQLCTVT